MTFWNPDRQRDRQTDRQTETERDRESLVCFFPYKLYQYVKGDV